MLKFTTSIFVLSFAACLAVSCGSKQTSTTSDASNKNDTTALVAMYDSIYDDTLNYARYFLVIADSGKDYAELEKQMQAIHQSTNLEIDLMGRSYNAKKDLICLAEDDPDEIYRGDYFPRRYPSTTMSIEYFDFFVPASTEKNMILLTGIFENIEEAKKQKELILPAAPHAFIVNTPVYVGCMH